MEGVLEQLKAFTSKFTLTQLIALVATFVLVVGLVVGSAWWLNSGDYVLLFDDMDAESAAQVRDRLLAAVEAHTEGRPAQDDRTVVVMKYSKP